MLILFKIYITWKINLIWMILKNNFHNQIVYKIKPKFTLKIIKVHGLMLLAYGPLKKLKFMKAGLFNGTKVSDLKIY